MGLSHSPGELQRLLEELLAPFRHFLRLSWTHVDTILLAGRPRLGRKVLVRLVARLHTTGFLINRRKSVLHLSPRIGFLGMTIDFRKQGFIPQAAYLDKVRHIVCRTGRPLPRRNSKRDQTYRGFLAFVLSVSIQFYAIMKLPWYHLQILIDCFLQEKIWIPFRQPAPTDYVDATPWTIVIYHPDTAFCMDLD